MESSKKGSFFDQEEYKARPGAETKTFKLWDTDFPPINSKDIRFQGELSKSEDPKNSDEVGHYVLTKNYLYSLRVKPKRSF